MKNKTDNRNWSDLYIATFKYNYVHVIKILLQSKHKRPPKNPLRAPEKDILAKARTIFTHSLTALKMLALRLPLGGKNEGMKE